MSAPLARVPSGRFRPSSSPYPNPVFPPQHPASHAPETSAHPPSSASQQVQHSPLPAAHRAQTSHHPYLSASDPPTETLSASENTPSHPHSGSASDSDARRN